MAWFKRKDSPAEFAVRRISFIGEQDGQIERQLKAKLAEFFQTEPQIISAFLARAHYGTLQETFVCLCLQRTGGDDRPTVDRIGRVFASIFAKTQHMDILFASDQQLRELRLVCRPFFSRT